MSDVGAFHVFSCSEIIISVCTNNWHFKKTNGIPVYSQLYSFPNVSIPCPLKEGPEHGKEKNKHIFYQRCHEHVCMLTFILSSKQICASPSCWHDFMLFYLKRVKWLWKMSHDKQLLSGLQGVSSYIHISSSEMICFDFFLKNQLPLALQAALHCTRSHSAAALPSIWFWTKLHQ